MAHATLVVVVAGGEASGDRAAGAVGVTLADAPSSIVLHRGRVEASSLASVLNTSNRRRSRCPQTTAEHSSGGHRYSSYAELATTADSLFQGVVPTRLGVASTMKKQEEFLASFINTRILHYQLLFATIRKIS